MALSCWEKNTLESDFEFSFAFNDVYMMFWICQCRNEPVNHQNLLMQKFN